MSIVSNKAVNDAATSNPRKSNKISSAHVSIFNVCCAYCKGKHHIFQCPNFLKLCEDRNKQVRVRRLCLNCLRSISHQAKDCKSSTCQTCSKKHNMLLHMQDKSQVETESTTQPSQASNSGTVVLTHHVAPDKYQQVILLSTAVVNIYDQHGNTHTCRALLDSGSQSNFITDSLAKGLNLVRKRANMSVTGIDKSQTYSEHVINVRIKSVHTSFSRSIECHVINSITENLPPMHININNFKIPNNIRLADPQFYTPAAIDMLIGAEIFWQLLCVGQIRVHKNLPIL